MDDFQTSFWSHVEDLRKVLLQILCIIFLGFLASLLFQDSLLSLITAPLYHAVPNAKLALLSPIEGFMASLKISLWASLILTLPLWIVPIIQFIAPALHTHERRAILPFVIASIAAIALGLSAAYYLTLPLANAYFYQFNESIGTNLWSLSAYLDFSLMLLFGHALVVECGLALLFLVHYGLISTDSLRRKRRLAIIGAFIVGALVTPPDVPSQLMVAIPLVGMYELSILYSSLRTSRVWNPNVN